MLHLLALLLALAPTQDDSTARDASRPLDERGLENLVAFSRLFGYVRFFHPIEEQDEAFWAWFAVEGARRAEPAGTPRELAAELAQLVQLFAPTVSVFPQGGRPGDSPALQRPEGVEKLFLRDWRHQGVQLSAGPNVYRSTRRRELVRGDALPEGCADPADPWRAQLAAGIGCRVPLALWDDGAGTLPHVDRAPLCAGLAPLEEYTAADRATRLAAVVMGWNVFQHFYPYFDVAEVDWRAELRRALHAAAEGAGEREFLDTLQRMVAALRDGHGNVLHPAFQDDGQLPVLWDWVEGALVVTEARPQVDLARGDVVLRIDGADVAEALAREEERISGATPQWIRAKALGVLRTGNQGESVALDVRSPSGEERSVEVAFGPPDFEFREPLPAPVEELSAGIWYLDLDRAKTEEFLEVLGELEEARGIVFDLRGYPRQFDALRCFPHLIREHATSAQWHIPVVTRPDGEGRDWMQSQWELDPKEPYLGAPKAFITGGGAISYAESCLAIVEHYRLAEIVGGPTAGTNGNINPFVLPGGYRVLWTGMRVLKHDGSRHHGVGILPTVPVERTLEGVIEGRDELLEAAVATVSR